MQNFSISCVPTDLHAMDRDKVSMFWSANIPNKSADLLAFNFRPKDINDDCMKLSDASTMISSGSQ